MRKAGEGTRVVREVVLARANRQSDCKIVAGDNMGDLMQAVTARLLLLLLAVGAVACGPDEPLKIATIQVGRSLNSDDSISGHTTTFKPDETIYTAVINETAGAGTVSVRWVYAGQTVSEETKELSFNREGATEFHLQTPSGEVLPEGDYRVEIQVDGQPAGTREFRVAK